MSRIDYDEKLVNDSLDLLHRSKQHVSYTESSLSSAIGIITSARGAEYLDTSYLNQGLDMPNACTQVIDSLIADIESKAQSILQYNSEIDNMGFGRRLFSTIGLAGSKIAEGFFTAGEQIIDGFASAIGWVGGLFSSDFKNSVGEFVKKDFVGDLFHSFYYNTDLGKSMVQGSAFKENGIAANIFKIGGTALGYTAAIALTGGVSGVASGTGFKAGVTAANSSLAMAASAAGIGGVGTGTQAGLQAGYDYDKAFGLGVKTGLISAGTVVAVNYLLKGAQSLFKKMKTKSPGNELSVIDDAANGGGSTNGGGSPNGGAGAQLKSGKTFAEQLDDILKSGGSSEDKCKAINDLYDIFGGKKGAPADISDIYKHAQKIFHPDLHNPLSETVKSFDDLISTMGKKGVTSAAGTLDDTVNTATQSSDQLLLSGRKMGDVLALPEHAEGGSVLLEMPKPSGPPTGLPGGGAGGIGGSLGKGSTGLGSAGGSTSGRIFGTSSGNGFTSQMQATVTKSAPRVGTLVKERSNFMPLFIIDMTDSTTTQALVPVGTQALKTVGQDVASKAATKVLTGTVTNAAALLPSATSSTVAKLLPGTVTKVAEKAAASLVSKPVASAVTAIAASTLPDIFTKPEVEPVPQVQIMPKPVELPDPQPQPQTQTQTEEKPVKVPPVTPSVVTTKDPVPNNTTQTETKPVPPTTLPPTKTAVTHKEPESGPKIVTEPPTERVIAVPPTEPPASTTPPTEPPTVASTKPAVVVPPTDSPTNPPTNSPTEPPVVGTTPSTNSPPIDSPPATEPYTTPKTIPDTTPKTTPDTTPKTTPDTTPKTTPNTTPKTTPDTTPKTTPDTTPKTTPDTTPKTTPDTTPVTKTDSGPNPGPSGGPSYVSIPNTGVGKKNMLKDYAVPAAIGLSAGLAGLGMALRKNKNKEVEEQKDESVIESKETDEVEKILNEIDREKETQDE